MSFFRLIRFALPVIALFLVTGCGVKPGALLFPSQNDAQEEKVASVDTKTIERQYPATYPDVRSDPPPPPVTVEHNMPPL